MRLIGQDHVSWGTCGATDCALNAAAGHSGPGQVWHAQDRKAGNCASCMFLAKACGLA